MPDRQSLVRTVLGGLTAMFRPTPDGAKSRAMAAPFEVTKSEAAWRRQLSPEQFYVLRQHGTEYAGSSPLDEQYDVGTYACAGCGLPLYSSSAKFNSGTGWPSFYAPLENAVGTTADRSFGMRRTEVHCRRCGGHLGHVFEDGPRPTGLRYCMNGAALTFSPGPHTAQDKDG